MKNSQGYDAQTWDKIGTENVYSINSGYENLFY